MSRYTAMFESLSARNEGALVPFTMLGDPDVQTSIEIIRTLVASGADALELGIAFSDPIADGPTIQAAGVRVLEAHIPQTDALELVSRVRREYPDLPIGLLVYANLVVRGGMDAFYARVRSAGVDSVVVADVPMMEAAPFLRAADQHGIDAVLIAPPNASASTIEAIAKHCRGYVYMVTRAGVTGADDTVKLHHRPLVDRLCSLGAPPVLFGFGISKPEHVRAALDAGAAGAITGSAVVDRIARNLNDKKAMLSELSAYVREMKSATKGRSPSFKS